MSQRETAYNNMLESGMLKQALSDPESIQQYLDIATCMLNDAKTKSLSHHGAFIVAYEGIFSLVMATLEFYGARPGDGEGHRVQAIQRVAADYGLVPDQFSALTRLHAERNRAIYKKPLPPISAEQVALTIQLLENLHTEAVKLLRPPPGMNGSK
jgi:hypothetical protein